MERKDILTLFNNRVCVMRFKKPIIVNYVKGIKNYILDVVEITVNDTCDSGLLEVTLEYEVNRKFNNRCCNDELRGNYTYRLNMITKRDFFIAVSPKEYKLHEFKNVAYDFCDDFLDKINNTQSSIIDIEEIGNYLFIDELPGYDYSAPRIPWYKMEFESTSIFPQIDENINIDDSLDINKYNKYLLKQIDKANIDYNSKMSDYQQDLRNKIENLINLKN